MEEKILIEAKNLKKYFKVGASSQLHAVDGVNFKIRRGTTLGVVGESGCGKPSNYCFAACSCVMFHSLTTFWSAPIE